MIPYPALLTLTFLPEELGAWVLPRAPRGLRPPAPRRWPRALGLLGGGRGVPKEQATASVLLAALGRGASQGMGDIAQVVITCRGNWLVVTRGHSP